MKYLDLTLPLPEANLACDEALLEACEEGELDEVLRVWEPDEPFVVLGYANRAQDEVWIERCRERGIPILRRCSGGGTVLQSAGCLNYTLVLQIDRRPELSSITGTNNFVMGAHRDMIGRLLSSVVTIEGATDLALADVKFSGNAQRRRRNCLLFHGAFLLGIDIRLMQEVLRPPTKEPSYRRHRSHREFVRNILLPSGMIKQSLRCVWRADDVLAEVPFGIIERLVKERYGSDQWNFKF